MRALARFSTRDYRGRDDRRWWLAEHGQCLSDAVFAAERSVESSTRARTHRIMQAYALYGDVTAWPGSKNVRLREARVSHNIIANAVDTLVSEVTQTQPRPMALTNGGDYDQRVRAEMLTGFWDASFDTLGIREIAPQVARDAVIAGLGVWRPYIDWDYGCVRVERIFPLLLKVDDRNCVDVDPRAIYLQRFVDRWQLMEQVANDGELDEERRKELLIAIEAAPPPEARHKFIDDFGADAIELIEAWHLPSVPCEHEEEEHEGYAHHSEHHRMMPANDVFPTDGRHCVVFAGETWIDEPYWRDRFPLPVMRPVPATRGFWPDSLVMRAAPAQTELNKLLCRIQDAMHLMSVPRVFVQNGTLNPAHLTTDVGAVINYTGSKPEVWTPQAMSGDVYQIVQQYAAWIYQEMGISELSANSVKPKGLNSGKAIDLYNDVQSKRFIGFERSYEHAHVWLAKELVVAQRELCEYGDVDSNVTVADGDDRDSTSFAEVDMDEQEYRVRVVPASAMATTAAQRVQHIEEMVASGLIPPELGFAALQNPDDKAIIDRIMAPRRCLEKVFSRMLRGFEWSPGVTYRPPEPYQNLVIGIDIAKVMLQEADLQGAPDDRMEHLRTWIADAAALLQRGEEAMQAEAAEKAAMSAPPMPPMGPPMGPPMPPMPPGGMPPPDAMMPPPGAMPPGAMPPVAA